ncbi:MAG: hypothetical protein WCD81_06070 [Candidatus Bathyarchaeia archaeon]
MRTIEVLLVIIIITGASIIASFFAFLPQPQQVSPVNLRRLALTTLEMLDSDHSLSQTVFTDPNDPSWNQLQTALSASLPAHIVYNLTVYDASTGGTQLYSVVNSLSNAQSLGISSDVATYLVASSNATFLSTPEKIGANGAGGTLYILNCSDSNGWWITGYTAQTLAGDLYNLLSPYFKATVMVQNTTQLGQLLNGTKISNSLYENVTNAVVINTNGEAVPIPAGYYMSSNVGYDPSNKSYALYDYTLGQRVHQYNWTWASIVGWPFYYVTNTNTTTVIGTSQNNWGIYGMVMVGSNGLGSFLEGLSNKSYTYANSDTNETATVVSLSNVAQYYSNYYGIYPSSQQTSTRAMDLSILGTYQLTVTTYILNPWGNWSAGAVYRHIISGNVTGSFMSLGLARTPDIRLTALGLLSDYKPTLFPSQYGASGTSRLVVLQLGEAGGV